MPMPARRIGQTATFLPEIRRAVVRSSGVSISTSSSARSFVASYVSSSVSSLTSWRNICVVVVTSRSRPSLCWTSGCVTSVTRPVDASRSVLVSTSSPSFRRRGRPTCRGRAGGVRRARRSARGSATTSASLASASHMIRPTSRKSSSSKPRIVIAGVPTRKPDATVGGRSSNGTVLRFTVIPTSARRSSASFPLHSVRRRSTSRSACRCRRSARRGRPPAATRRAHRRSRAPRSGTRGTAPSRRSGSTPPWRR